MSTLQHPSGEAHPAGGVDVGPPTAAVRVAQIGAAMETGQWEQAAALLRAAIEPGLDLTAALSLCRLLRRYRSAQPPKKEIRLALLCNFTPTQLVPLVQLFLYASGVDVSVYVPDYGTFRQEVLDPSSRLYAEKPSTVILATSWRDVGFRPVSGQKRDETDRLIQRELQDWASLWTTLHERLGCQIIQNNFDAPPSRPLGNHEMRDPAGFARYLAGLNLALQDSAPAFVTIHDLDHLAADHGRWTWGDERYFHLAKIPCAPECQVDYAHSLASLVVAQQGLSKKCLVLDLDNTLWGGVIGDDGLGGIRLGQGDAEGEAFVAFQRYAKELRARGVLLAVCSKNEHTVAKEVFDRHSEMVLRYDDISCFVANWSDKPANLRLIAQKLNIGINSLVFVDDNPAERSIVRQMLPEVAVPELTADPADYVRCLERHRYFQTLSLSDEDYQRADYYRANAEREAACEATQSIDDFLRSLQMVAYVRPIRTETLERSTQLINKSNQFNLTTRRYTSAAVMQLLGDPAWLTLTVSLTDRFGDNGLISVLLARIEGAVLDIDTWLMSCRVLKRGVENMLLAELCGLALRRGLAVIRGTYKPTAKNGLVAEHYASLGFRLVHREEGGSTHWELNVGDYRPTPIFIEVRRDD